MLGALLILSFAIFLAFFEPILATKKSSTKENTKYDAEIKKLWTIAKDSMNSRKTLRAEKALLTILNLMKLMPPPTTVLVFFTQKLKTLTKLLSVLRLLNHSTITQCLFITLV